MSRIMALALILVLIQFTLAQEAGLMEESSIYRINSINLQIHENGFVDVEEELEVNNTIASILAPRNILDLMILDSRGNSLQYDSASKDGMQLITFYLRSPDERAIRLRYKTMDLTSKNASIWTLRFSALSVPRHTIIKIVFPFGSEVISLRPKDILRYPQNLTSPLWLYPQITDFSFECDYATGPSTPQGGDIYVYALAAMVLVIISLLIYIFFIKRRSREAILEEVAEEPVDVRDDKEEGSNIKSSVLNVLEENERLVVEVIEKANDEITQAYVYKTTGIPKATLSDLMRRLETRNIIERRRDGRINWIKLQEWVFNK
jgi:uncharacterized membrane protein